VILKYPPKKGLQVSLKLAALLIHGGACSLARTTLHAKFRALHIRNQGNNESLPEISYKTRNKRGNPIAKS
jgi:hypothetical protein